MSAGTIVLVGPPGAGKSTVGRLLADATGRPLVDTDEQIVADTGRAIADIFVDSGEVEFRRIERDVVARTLAAHEGVVALGGGSILDEATRRQLAGATVIFLDVALRDASRRAGFDQGRPLLALNPRGQWLALMEARRPLYEGVATHVVDTGGRSAQEVCDEIVGLLGGEPA